MTKYLTREQVDNAIDNMGQVVQEGRANSNLDIQGKVKYMRESISLDKMTKTTRKSSTVVGGACASATGLDRWEVVGEQVVRFHSQPRSALFAVTAKDVSPPGVRLESLGPIRTTRGRDQQGNEFALHDYWRASRRPQRHQPFLWTGTTTFHNGGEQIAQPNK